MRRSLALLGVPRYPAVLVGGTNGKGSVAAALHRIFSDFGLRVGLTTSPHLLDVRERIRVGEEAISAADFDASVNAAFGVDLADEATYFEILALAALHHFNRAGVDLAIVEIGLGGRLDAFNVIDPIVSVITNVGLEHTRWLGETIEAIAAEKAPIARAGRPVILGCDLPILRQECERIGAEVVAAHREDRAAFREQNDRTAVAAAERIAGALGLPFDEEAAARSTARAWWPGRFEVLRPAGGGRPEILLDGAHNPPAAVALARRLESHAAGRRVVGLVAFLSDKDVPGWFVALDPVVEAWVVTSLEEERALAPASVPRPYNAEVMADRMAAFRAAEAAAGPDGIVLVTGSLYNVGAFLRSHLSEL